MKKRRTREVLLMVLFFCLTNIAFGQIQTKTDTILCHNKNLIIEYPAIHKINVVNYEEGYFKIINCVLDSAAIIIHCGSMINLPLTDLSDKIICSEFVLGKDVRSIRGYYMTDNGKKYFREDNYFKYGIAIVYEHVGETKLKSYEHFFQRHKNTIKTLPMKSIRFYLVVWLLILTCCNNIGSKKAGNSDNIVPT